MDNFRPYIKLHIQMIKEYFLGMVLMAVFLWFSMEVMIVYILFIPLVLSAILWCWSKISTHLIQESLFGPQASFYMCLPVSEEAIIASRILILGVCNSVALLCLVVPAALSQIFREMVKDLLLSMNSHQICLFVLILLTILMLSFTIPAMDLVRAIRYHAFPLRKRKKRLNYPARVAVYLLILSFFWTDSWRRLAGAIGRWLAGPFAIPVAVVLLIAAIFFTAKAFRAGVRLMKDRYQWA